MKNRIKSAGAVMKDAFKGFSDDKVMMMGAALSYYTAFSIAPLLVIAIGVAGLVFGKGGGQQIFQAIQGLVGENGGRAIQGMVEAAASRPRSGAVAAALGVATLLVGASGVFGQLQEALNVIWKVTLKPSAGWWTTIRRRLLSFGMVGVIAFILTVSLVVSAALAAAGEYMSGTLPGGETLWQLVNLVVSMAVLSGLFASTFKVLPDVKLPWRDALAGGVFTAALFSVGKLAIGAYIGKSGVATAYGAAGSLIVVLLWVYYSSQILLLGAETTRAYAAARGRPIVPKDEAAVTVTPFNAAAMAERVVASAERRPIQEELPSYWYLAAAAGLLGGGLTLSRAAQASGRRREAAYAAGGLGMGAGLGILALLEQGRRARAAEHRGEKEEKPSFVASLVGKIPLKVKLAAVGGALKSGGAEALHEAADAVRDMVHPEPEAREVHPAHSARASHPSRTRRSAGSLHHGRHRRVRA